MNGWIGRGTMSIAKPREGQFSATSSRHPTLWRAQWQVSVLAALLPFASTGCATLHMHSTDSTGTKIAKGFARVPIAILSVGGSEAWHMRQRQAERWLGRSKADLISALGAPDVTLNDYHPPATTLFYIKRSSPPPPHVPGGGVLTEAANNSTANLFLMLWTIEPLCFAYDVDQTGTITSAGWGPVCWDGGKML